MPHTLNLIPGVHEPTCSQVLASAKASLRTAAMDAVGKAITGALARPVPLGECCCLTLSPLRYI